MAGTGLAVLLPLFFVVAVAIKLDDGGPVFYAQSRVGRRFRLFRLIKFRTMVAGADRDGLLTAMNDARVTRAGRWLRACKLDELPQLLNVVKGEMQLVGARPEVPKYVALFSREYAVILQERPGITDPASLAYRREERLLSEGDAEEQYLSEVLPKKVSLSLEYQQRRTLGSDLHLLLRTVCAIVSGSQSDKAPGV